MRRVVITLIVVTLGLPAGSLAQGAPREPQPSTASEHWRSTPLLNAGIREARRMGINDAAQQSRARQSWPARHPVALGTLVGAAGGALFALIATADDCNEGCDPPRSDVVLLWTALGTGLGFGVGALVDWALDR